MEFEVVYLGKKEQALLTICVEGDQPTCSISVKEAILLSKILELNELKEYRDSPDTLAGRVGIFGKIIPLNTAIQEGDRIEIYRTLVNDPKQARKDRAAKNRKKKKS